MMNINVEEGKKGHRGFQRDASLENLGLIINLHNCVKTTYLQNVNFS